MSPAQHKPPRFLNSRNSTSFLRADEARLVLILLRFCESLCRDASRACHSCILRRSYCMSVLRRCAGGALQTGKLRSAIRVSRVWVSEFLPIEDAMAWRAGVMGDFNQRPRIYAVNSAWRVRKACRRDQEDSMRYSGLLENVGGCGSRAPAPPQPPTPTGGAAEDVVSWQKKKRPVGQIGRPRRPSENAAMYVRRSPR